MKRQKRQLGWRQRELEIRPNRGLVAGFGGGSNLEDFGNACRVDSNGSSVGGRQKSLRKSKPKFEGKAEDGNEARVNGGRV